MFIKCYFSNISMFRKLCCGDIWGGGGQKRVHLYFLTYDLSDNEILLIYLLVNLVFNGHSPIWPLNGTCERDIG